MEPLPEFPPDRVPPLTAPASSLEEYDDRLVNRMRRNARRKSTVSVLPALPAEELAPEGLSRFDWRQRSLSRMGRTKGLSWFPGAVRKRVRAMASDLAPGETFHDELVRYQNQYVQ
jgi:hypothetical protein